jgi:intraflagellar transport protein 74
VRPGSGRKPPGTAQRLRTGVTPAGPGTQAAQGISLTANVNVMDRPVTGQGLMGMKMQSGGGRLVEDASYYVGLLRKKMTDITNETRKLRVEIEQQSKETSQYSQLEKRYETLLKNKETLEGQLADYNIALDKTRSSTDPDDVRQLSLHLAEKNRNTGQELDRVFTLRKQKENDINHVEDQIESQYRAIQARINDLEPGKLRSYNEILSKQKEYQERIMINDNRLNEVNARIRQLEGEDKSSSYRKEYSSLEKTYQSLKRDLESLHQELEIANLDPKDAHTKFVARVNDFKQGTKNLDDKIIGIKDEINTFKKNLDDLNSNKVDDSNDAAKYELLQKRDEEMTAFMDKFDESRNTILSDQQRARDVIVALLEHISRGLDESGNMVTPDALNEMEDAKTFKEKNIATAQKTMESLHAEKRKREKELEVLRSSEPKLAKELSNLKDSMTRMSNEIIAFQDLESVRKSFEITQSVLQDQRLAYIKRRDAIRQQVQALSSENESLKKQLNANDIARELDDTEKRLKHHERSIFELKEFVSSKSRETDYEAVKGACLKMLDSLNSTIIKRSQQPIKLANQAKW